MQLLLVWEPERDALSIKLPFKNPLSVSFGPLVRPMVDVEPTVSASTPHQSNPMNALDAMASPSDQDIPSLAHPKTPIVDTRLDKRESFVYPTESGLSLYVVSPEFVYHYNVNEDGVLLFKLYALNGGT